MKAKLKSCDHHFFVVCFETCKSWGDTVDGNPANQLISNLYIYTIVFRVFYIPAGAGFLPSTVATKTSPQLVQRHSTEPPAGAFRHCRRCSEGAIHATWSCWRFCFPPTIQGNTVGSTRWAHTRYK